MMIGGKAQAFHARARRGAHNLIRTEITGIKQGRGFVTITPILVGEGIDGEMKKAVKFRFVPCQLPQSGHGTIQFWSLDGILSARLKTGGTHGGEEQKDRNLLHLSLIIQVIRTDGSASIFTRPVLGAEAIIESAKRAVPNAPIYGEV